MGSLRIFFWVLIITVSVNLFQSLSLIYKVRAQKNMEAQEVLVLKSKLDELDRKVDQLKGCGPGTEHFLRRHFGMKRKEEIFSLEED